MADHSDRTSIFLKNHMLRASDININDLVSVFLNEMNLGLAGKESSLRMIPTYIEAENKFLKDTPVLAIDAGGTNFRAAMITFKSNGEVEFGDIARHSMPGLDEEISCDRFFEIIGGYIKPFIGKTDRIGFCFSYPTEILPNKDGRLLQFCKEVKAPEVVGQLIGRSLLDSLNVPSKKIVLLNDTVATLLAGKSVYQDSKYDSYMGFILGTGTNTCYIERNINIIKNSSLNHASTQIINIESGNFAKAPRAGFDLQFDATTTDPGKYSFEKMFSGGYFGSLCLTILKGAASDGVLSGKALTGLNGISELTTEEVNDFIKGKECRLSQTLTDEYDIYVAGTIIDCLIDRAACLVAANLSATVLKCGKGKESGHPILVTVEGTTFYKLHNLQERIMYYLESYLSGDRKRYLEFVQVENSSLLGAALAGLIV
jgi:hexokinase